MTHIGQIRVDRLVRGIVVLLMASLSCAAGGCVYSFDLRMRGWVSDVFHHLSFLQRIRIVHLPQLPEEWIGVEGWGVLPMPSSVSFIKMN